MPQERMTAAELRKLTAKPKGANSLEAPFGEHLRLLHLDGIITEPKYHRVHDPKSLHLPLLPPCGLRRRTLKLTPDWTFQVAVDDADEFNQCGIVDGLLDLWEWAQGDDPTILRVAVDCKGFLREDAWLKIRLAACLYPDIAFFIVRKVRGGWKWERVRGGKLGGKVKW